MAYYGNKAAAPRSGGILDLVDRLKTSSARSQREQETTKMPILKEGPLAEEVVEKQEGEAAH